MSIYRTWVNENTEVVNEGALATVAVYTALITAFAIICSKIGKANSKSKAVKSIIADSKVQEQFKKVFNLVSDAAKKDSEYKADSKFFNFFQYEYDVTTQGNRVVINFDIAEVDVEKLFKSLYGVSIKEYNKDNDDSNSYKPAPKFKDAIKKMETDTAKFYSKFKEKIKNCESTLKLLVDYDDMGDLETHYGDCVGYTPIWLQLSLVLDLDKLKSSKTVNIGTEESALVSEAAKMTGTYSKMGYAETNLKFDGQKITLSGIEKGNEEKDPQALLEALDKSYAAMKGQYKDCLLKIAEWLSKTEGFPVMSLDKVAKQLKLYDINFWSFTAKEGNKYYEPGVIYSYTFSYTPANAEMKKWFDAIGMDVSLDESLKIVKIIPYDI